MSSTLTSMLAAHADDAPAIGASEKSWLTYGALRSLSHEVRTSLRTNGIGAKDRVAIVLPNGRQWRVRLSLSRKQPRQRL